MSVVSHAAEHPRLGVEPGSQRQVTLITPAHAGDLERFQLQRESIARCGIDLPHVALVDDEDVPLFRDLHHSQGLAVISTRDVLSRRLEGRRRAWGVRRRDPRYWWRTRGAGKPIHGWGVQQILKLSAPRVVETPGIVCIDCDTFFVGHVTADDFFGPDGRLHLYETDDDVDAEMAEWPAHCMRFLGIKPTGRRLWRYTHSPVPFQRDVLLDLQAHIERRHGRPWAEAFIDQRDWVLEYTTYGVYAREVDGLTRVVPVKPPLSAYFWWPEETARIAETFRDVVGRHGARIVGVQANTGVRIDAYRPHAEAFWNSAKVGFRNGS